MMFFKHRFESIFLQRPAAFDARGFAVRIGDAALEHVLVFADDELKVPLLNEPIAVFDHRGDFISRVHMH